MGNLKKVINYHISFRDGVKNLYQWGRSLCALYMLMVAVYWDAGGGQEN